MEDKFAFYKYRGVGEIIGDTIELMKRNAKPMFRAVFAIIFPFFIGLAILGITVMRNLIETTRGSLEPGGDVGALFANLGLFFLIFLLASFVSILFYNVIYCSLLLYEEGETDYSVSDVWQRSMSRFVPQLINVLILFGLYMGVSMVNSIAMLVFQSIMGPAAVLILYIIIIGLAMYVLLAMFIAVKEGDGSKAFLRSINLVKYNYWKTFGAMFLVYIIQGVVVGGFTFLGVFIGQQLMTVTDSVALAIFIPAIAFIPVLLVIYTFITLVPATMYYTYMEDEAGLGLDDSIEQLGE